MSGRQPTHSPRRVSFWLITGLTAGFRSLGGGVYYWPCRGRGGVANGGMRVISGRAVSRDPTPVVPGPTPTATPSWSATPTPPPTWRPPWRRAPPTSRPPRTPPLRRRRRPLTLRSLPPDSPRTRQVAFYTTVVEGLQFVNSSS